MFTQDYGVLKEIPGYKALLKAVIKSQMQMLVSSCMLIGPDIGLFFKRKIVIIFFPINFFFPINLDWCLVELVLCVLQGAKLELSDREFLPRLKIGEAWVKVSRLILNSGF